MRGLPADALSEAHAGIGPIIRAWAFGGGNLHAVIQPNDFRSLDFLAAAPPQPHELEGNHVIPQRYAEALPLLRKTFPFFTT